MVPSSQNMYSDDDDSSAAPAPESHDDSQSESQTALIPKAVFGKDDVKPGDEVHLRCTSVHGDEVMCEKCDEGDYSDKDDSAPESKVRPDSPGPLSSMLED